MKAVMQRVEKAVLYVREDELDHRGEIDEGLLVFVGIEKADTLDDLAFMAKKIVFLRIFEDERQKLNLSVKDKSLAIMCIPNFTLSGTLDRGRRPSFDNAASKDKASEYFDTFCQKIEAHQIRCMRGIFGASMIIEARNYGPVNIIIDTAELRKK